MRFLVTVKLESGRWAQSVHDDSSAEEAKKFVGPVIAQAMNERAVSVEAEQVADDYS